MRYGASPAEWTHFSLFLGLTADLLPVVSKPDARISPRSKLKSLGKTPSRFDREGLVVGIAKWTELIANHDQVAAWSKEQNYGICIQTREIRAIDVDVEDAAAVARIRLLVQQHFGSLPVRTRPGTFRVLIAFRLPGALAKRTARTAEGLIELLGDGQQFIAAGTHPKGARYGWENGLPETIPEVTAEAVEAFWSAIGGDAAAEGTRKGHLAEASAGAGAAGDDPVVSWLLGQGWVTGWGRDEQVNIACPWQIDHTSDSGETETAYWPAGTGGYQQGHFKCLHAHCAGRTDEEFLAAIGFERSAVVDFSDVADGAVAQLVDNHDRIRAPAAPVGAPQGAGGPAGSLPFSPPASVSAWNSPTPGVSLRRSRKGFEAEMHNTARAVDTPGFWRRFAYDTFRCCVVHCAWDSAAGEEEWSALTTADLLEGRALLRRSGFEPVGRETMRDAVEHVARRRTIDSAQLWLGRLRWDGVGRVAGFLERYFGASGHGGYAEAISRYLWTALAGRILQPGVQVDMVPIFVGRQGLKKTRSIEMLAPSPDLYVTVDLGMHDAETARRMRGRLVWEVAELKGLHSRDRTAINSFVTERADTWVPKYEEFAQTVPRRGLFIGTSNDAEFLDDETGNRRWLPIEVGIVDREAVIEDRLQLWAEGAAMFAVDGVAWSDAELLAKNHHERFRITDIWEVELREWLEKRPDPTAPFTTRDAALGIGLDPRTINRGTEMRLAKVLRQLGTTSGRPRNEVGTQYRAWIYIPKLIV